MMSNLTKDSWRAVGWSPVIYPGTVWRFGARLVGAKPGEIIGGALFVNGIEYPLEANDDRVTFELEPSIVDSIPHKAPCGVYIDHRDNGRFLWLSGSVTRGGSAR